MRAILDVIMLILDLYWWIIIISAVFSWLYAFNVINMRNQFVAMIGNFIHQATEPVYRRIRPFMPNLGTIDITPIAVLIAIFFLQRLIIYYVYPIAI